MLETPVSIWCIVLLVVAGIVCVGSIIAICVIQEPLPVFIGFAVAILLIFIACGIHDSNQKAHAHQLYETGCPTCGESFEFYQAVGHLSKTSFLYKCEGCDNMFESDEILTIGEAK